MRMAGTGDMQINIGFKPQWRPGISNIQKVLFCRKVRQEKKAHG
jgi:hypothetical protein